MGEVYRARDSKLNRDVAIKVLLAEVADDPDRLARFSREAQVLASLNHPNIAHIHGLEDGGRVRALVMELVDGPTLADRIARGPIPLGEALPIAKQIAEALEAAHEQGIIHRDLKPANIKVRPDGTVKVLDFGLAKAVDPASGLNADPMNSPTITSPAMSGRGVILGTAAYMSPEQAAGKAVDKRSDLWSFGVVLLEMLTGRQVFDGETVSHVLAAVLTKEPGWRSLPASTPDAIRRLLRRCLEKDRKRRLDSAADARLDIEDALSTPAEASAGGRSVTARAGTIVVAVVGTAIVAAVATWVLTRPTPAVPAAVTRFTIAPSSALPMNDYATAAPDGSFVVYNSGERLVVRRLDRLDASPIAGIRNAYGAFMSPDSRWIGYIDNFTLKKVAVTGGAPITLAQLPGLPFGVSWVDGTTLIAATNNGTTGLLRVSTAGGEPAVLTTVDQARGEQGHWFPFVLPGGRAVLFTIAAAQPGNAQIAILDLHTGQRTMLIRGGSDARYVASGHLVYASGSGLSAVRFDLARRAVVGDPVAVVEGVTISTSGAAKVTVTETGTLVYVPGAQASAARRTLVWVDRRGRETPIQAPPRDYVGPRLSPDATQIAVEIRDQENDIWIWDLARQALRRLTFDPAIDRDPVWTPDGRRVIFASSRTGAFDLYARAADGTGTDVRLTASTNSQYAMSVTPDGAYVIGNEVRLRTAFDVVRFALNGTAAGRGGFAAAEGLVETPFQDRNPEVSPDGRFLAYQSDESGRAEIYVRPYPQTANGRWEVSSGGGSRPAWARSGRELFYLDAANQLTVVPVETTGATFRAGAAARVLATAYAGPFAWRPYDVSPDGQRFLMLKNEVSKSESAAPPGIVVVQNWLEELKRLVPEK